MRDLNRLRAEAETLASELPEFSVLTRQQATAHPGGAPRQRAGHGEDFWQYRGRTPEDSANAIDWRRSATGDELFIREHELQTARQMEIWVDPSSGFDWTSVKGGLTKAEEARIILAALAFQFCAEGDRARVLGSGKGAFNAGQVIQKSLEAFDQPNRSDVPSVPKRDSSIVIIASDFYSNLDDMARAISSAASDGASGMLLQICDPMEVEFPFSGRVKFRRPGSTLSRIFGRTEDLKDTYEERFKKRQDAVRALAARIGWGFETHVLGNTRRPLAFRMMQDLAGAGAPR